MAPDTKYDARLEEGLLPVASDEKRGLTTSRTTKETTRKMTGPRRVVIAFVVCGLMTLSLASVIGHRGMPCAREHKSQVPLTEDDLKDPAKADVVHQLLHAYYPDRYQDGVYPSDKEAIEAVGADAKLASALLQLAKRQDNTTASATEASQTPSVTVATTPTSDSPANTPTPTSTTPQETTSAPQPETTTTPPAETTTTQQPPSTQEQPTTTAQTTNQAQQTTPTTTATSAPLNSEQNTGQTTAATSSRRTTTSFSEVRSTFTSTASNGDVVLVTATSVVAIPPDPEPTSASGGSSGGGGLQNGAVPIGNVNFGLPLAFAGFIAGAMLLL